MLDLRQPTLSLSLVLSVFSSHLTTGSQTQTDAFSFTCKSLTGESSVLKAAQSTQMIYISMTPQKREYQQAFVPPCEDQLVNVKLLENSFFCRNVQVTLGKIRQVQVAA